MQQLRFHFQHDEFSLRTYLEHASRRTVSLVITDNSSSMLYLKPAGDTVRLRLHRMFLNADGDVLDELADFIRNNRKKTPLVSKFINLNVHTLKKSTPKKVTVRTLGKQYDLQAIYTSVNKKYFNESITAVITWGTRNAAYTARRRTLGSYSSHTNTIRINPLLDSRRVPRYYIEFIVYHEMLHACLGPETDGQKRVIYHSRRFKEHERQFEHYERALSWEKKKRLAP